MQPLRYFILIKLFVTTEFVKERRLIRDKVDFGILEGFLSELIGEDIRIETVLESESNQQTEGEKFNRVDLLVENTKKELIIRPY